ncbi:CYTH domain-containing protein [Gelidibacter salicanalis]|uniref:CYTH domain-containing protein n=1 Tax=Gelidibacter salicanalis TaxID=291193 RepID=A0A934KKK1_9FLAO|nr:CYTH domain-containing protein [Gelidibacter salicanalis]MBJ7879484.1 CYTH domain-containing protein [Gelidibacter salicanalis]
MSKLIEIERKFLVLSDQFKSEAFKKTRIVQAFLNSDKSRTVRVRLKGDQGFLTIKGETSDDGVSRFEWEKEISKSDAEALLQLCEEGMIDKIRYEVQSGEHVFEVDEFFGVNEGLVVAEVELNEVAENFHKPNWLGEEVTGQLKYFNSQLVKHPFKNWD